MMTGKRCPSFFFIYSLYFDFIFLKKKKRRRKKKKVIFKSMTVTNVTPYGFSFSCFRCEKSGENGIAGHLFSISDAGAHRLVLLTVGNPSFLLQSILCFPPDDNLTLLSVRKAIVYVLPLFSVYFPLSFCLTYFIFSV